MRTDFSVFNGEVTNVAHGAVEFGDRCEMFVDGALRVSIPAHHAGDFAGEQNSLNALVTEAGGGLCPSRARHGTHASPKEAVGKGTLSRGFSNLLRQLRQSCREGQTGKGPREWGKASKNLELQSKFNWKGMSSARGDGLTCVADGWTLVWGHRPMELSRRHCLAQGGVLMVLHRMQRERGVESQ
jgi:hypothetical protein